MPTSPTWRLPTTRLLSRSPHTSSRGRVQTNSPGDSLSRRGCFWMIGSINVGADRCVCPFEQSEVGRTPRCAPTKTACFTGKSQRDDPVGDAQLPPELRQQIDQAGVAPALGFLQVA